MRRHTKASPARQNPHKPAGRGTRAASGRLGLVILAAAVAAFFIAPVAQAAAEGLKVNLAGSGSGSIKDVTIYAETEPLIECPGVCEAAITEEFAPLAAIPNAGSEFTGWTIQKGAAYALCDGSQEEKEFVEELKKDFPEYTGTQGACFIEEAGGEAELTATFALIESSLAITKAGTGTGTIQCKIDGGAAEACAASYPNGKKIEVIATANSGSTFAGFSAGTGSAAGCSASCSFKIEADSTVTATFTLKTCVTDSSLCPPPPPPPPPPPSEGHAKASPTASVKGGKAALTLTCTGGPCKGTLQLTAKVKQGKKTKNLVIGKASFGLADGANTTLKVKLSGPAKQELAKGKTLKAKAGGTDVTPSTVKLKPAKK